MGIKVTSSFYESIGKELSSYGIFINPDDIFILVKIIMKNLVLSLMGNKDNELYIDRSITIKRNKRHDTIVLKYNNRLFGIPRRFEMTDVSSQKILRDLFLPIIEREKKEGN